MIRSNCTREAIVAGAMIAVLGPLAVPAAAADLPLKARMTQTVFDWTGLYVGVHAGYTRDHARATLTDPSGIASAGSPFSGLTGGVQAGYNWVTRSGLLLGLEGDFSFPNYLTSNHTVASLNTAQSSVDELWDYVATARGRVGYVQGNWLVYATGGLAWTGGRFTNTNVAGEEEKLLTTRLGWVAGAGIERGFAPHWSWRLEYLYNHFDNGGVRFSNGASYASALDFQTLRVGLNRKLDFAGGPDLKLKSDPSNPESDRWEIHGQATVIGQGYPAFRAAYTGANSLTTARQFQETWSNSLYLNARLWDGGEVYYNPELLQGFGLSNTAGIGGFPNGEAQKSDFPYPHYNTSRLFLRQTFGFGGEQETLGSGQLQLAGKQDVSRLTFQIGKFAVLDGNAYAKDTRKDFMNWSVWAPGAFDYAADKLGLTYGATAELNQKNWALRTGYFLMDAVSNSNSFDMNVFRRGQYVVELETRYQLFSQPGHLRTIGWFNSVFSGSYRETLDNLALNLDISQTRRGRSKFGYVVSFDQALSDDVGLFGRWSWNDGKTEIMAFTDIDSSLSLGTSIRGVRWGRPDDTIGIAGVSNGLSRDHRAFLAAGGVGPLIGDGALNYRRENIVEAYYAYSINKYLTFTADYQFVSNPAYTADRGPVSIFSGRLHGDF
jgi:high affinity Mn2+ porin